MNINRIIKNNPLMNYFLIIEIITIISIVLDLIFIRQLFSFISLTFIPGYLILKKLKVKLNDIYNWILVSIGLSIFYVMMLGLAINLILPILDIQNPLSEFNILVIFLFMNLILIIINFFDKNNENSYSYNISTFINNNKYITLLTTLVFIFNIVFNYLAYYLESKNIYITLVINIVFLYIFIFYKYNEKYKSIYYIFIYVISFSLLLQNLLTSNFLVGSDINIEYFVFKITKNNSYWDPFFFGPNVWEGIVNYNSMLGITILPTIYSHFFSIKDDILFKILYPFILSLIPLILVKIYDNFINEHKYSFLYVLFFVSDDTIFYGIEPLNLSKQITAVFFMLLFFLVLSLDDIQIRYKQILLLIFGSSIFLSHYATSYIFLFLIFFLYFINKIIFKKDINLTINIILFLFSIKVLWDSFVTIKTINQIYYYIEQTYRRFLLDLIDTTARSVEISRIIRPGTIIYKTHRIFFYLVHIFLSIGVVSIFFDRKNNKMNNMYKIISLLSYLMIVVVLLIPSISYRFGITRFRSISMLFLTPFIVIGYQFFISSLLNLIDIKSLDIKDIILLKFIKYNPLSDKKKYFSLIYLILIIYFFFNIGFVNYIFEDKPLSFTFDSDRKKTYHDVEIVVGYYTEYKTEWDVRSTLWLSENANNESEIYTDFISSWHVLISYGLMDNARVNQFNNNTVFYEGNYIYLNYLGAVKSITPMLRTGAHTALVIPYNTSILTPTLNINNKIYSNGNNDIYLSTSKDNNQIIIKEE